MRRRCAAAHLEHEEVPGLLVQATHLVHGQALYQYSSHPCSNIIILGEAAELFTDFGQKGPKRGRTSEDFVFPLLILSNSKKVHEIFYFFYFH
jgi:hypothetical protein